MAAGSRACVQGARAAVYRRYAIVDEAMLREGAAKLARLSLPSERSALFSVPFQARTT